MLYWLAFVKTLMITWGCGLDSRWITWTWLGGITPKIPAMPFHYFQAIYVNRTNPRNLKIWMLCLRARVIWRSFCMINLDLFRASCTHALHSAIFVKTPKELVWNVISALRHICKNCELQESSWISFLVKLFVVRICCVCKSPKLLQNRSMEQSSLNYKPCNGARTKLNNLKDVATIQQVLIQVIVVATVVEW